MDTIQVGDPEVISVTEVVCTSVLGIVPEHETGLCKMIGKAVTACVQITGAWYGAVLIRLDQSLAQDCANLMFATDNATPEEVRDSVGEIVNMIGGNLKSVLPGPSKLSLPTVLEGDNYSVRIPGTAPLSSVCFTMNGKGLEVSVLQQVE